LVNYTVEDKISRKERLTMKEIPSAQVDPQVMEKEK